MYLVDTNVISAGAPTKSQAVPGLMGWMEANASRLHLSVITVAEIEDGIAKARRQNATRKADRLADWLETLLHLYAARILRVDIAVARRIGALSDQARAAGLAPGLADLAIGTTAASRGFMVLTRNLRHFRALSVLCHDPLDSLPLETGVTTGRTSV